MSPAADRSAADRMLRARLRRTDPAAVAPEAESAALARLARRLAADATQATTPWPRRYGSTLGPVFAAAVVTAVALLARGAWHRTAAESANAEPPHEPPTWRGEPPAETPRQLQFETPGGTRVVWLLDPNLSF